MKTYEFRMTITTDLDLSRDQVIEAFHKLLAAGQADAQDTCDDHDMEDAHEDAETALSLLVYVS